MKQGRSDPLNPADGTSAIASAAYLTGLNQLFPNMQPVILGALVGSYGFGDTALGQISASFMAFNTLCIIGAPFWIRRVNWRMMTFIAAAVAAMLMIAGLWIVALPLMLTVFGLFGLATGVIGAPAFTSLGDTTNPDRTYGIALVVQSGLGALGLMSLSSWIIPHYGAAGVFATLAAMFSTGLLVCRWLPKGGNAAGAAGETPYKVSLLSASTIPPLISMLATFLFIGGALGFWFFSERIGVARGVAPVTIALTLSLSAFAQISASAFVAWAASRLPSIAYVIGGTIICLSGFLLLQLPGSLPFIIATFLFAAGFGMAQPGYWSISRKVDATGRLFVATPAAAGFAGVAMGIVAGPVIERGGYDGLIMICSALFIAGGVFLMAASRLHARMSLSEA